MQTSVLLKDDSLDKPGAGLPWYQYRFIQHIVVPLMPKVYNWEKSLNLFQRQVKEIVALVKDLDEDTLSKQVLVPHLFALEDSSRFWSINMVLEHLVTVNAGSYEMVETLGKEEEVTMELLIAKVKPLSNTNHLKKYEVFEKVYSRMIKKNTNINSRATKSHPWFGPFNNFMWHAFTGIHNRVHKRQIKHILKTLKVN